ncbi:MAG: HTH domain-containing protein [Prevotellaceae bacterium]|jgi:transcriptional antiterminator|nr:HTH domain-containing protein [Prevotellaceae bacterium]
MNHFDTINRLRRIHQEIMRECTGTPNAFAEKMHISRRQIYNIIDELKIYGVDIKYNRKLKTFYYDSDIDALEKLNISFIKK